MSPVWVSDPGDEIDAISVELDDLRRQLARAERAEVEHRVTDRDRWLEQLAHRRDRIRRLEEQRDELVAAEESAAELSESFRPGDAE